MRLVYEPRGSGAKNEGVLLDIIPYLEATLIVMASTNGAQKCWIP